MKPSLFIFVVAVAAVLIISSSSSSSSSRSIITSAAARVVTSSDMYALLYSNPPAVATVVDTPFTNFSGSAFILRSLYSPSRSASRDPTTITAGNAIAKNSLSHVVLLEVCGIGYRPPNMTEEDYDKNNKNIPNNWATLPCGFSTPPFVVDTDEQSALLSRNKNAPFTLIRFTIDVKAVMEHAHQEGGGGQTTVIISGDSSSNSSSSGHVLEGGNTESLMDDELMASFVNLHNIKSKVSSEYAQFITQSGLALAPPVTLRGQVTKLVKKHKAAAATIAIVVIFVIVLLIGLIVVFVLVMPRIKQRRRLYEFARQQAMAFGERAEKAAAAAAAGSAGAADGTSGAVL